MRCVALYLYPVKGLRGVSVDALELSSRGPRPDREWLVVDVSDRFLTQRSVPRMATLSATVIDGALRLADDLGSQVLVDAKAGGDRRRVTVWKDQVDALDVGDDAASWLSERLGQPCRLVRFPEGEVRPLDPAFSPRPDAQTGFADAYPVLLTNQASLDELNTRLTSPIGMDRFRPNVVVSGAFPWAEEGWRALQVGEVVLDLVKPCSRCVVITTDQRSGARPQGSEPLSVLASYKTLAPFGAIFGQNAVHRAPGVLRLTDPVTVL